MPTRHLHPEGYLVSPSAQRLPRLRRPAGPSALENSEASALGIAESTAWCSFAALHWTLMDRSMDDTRLGRPQPRQHHPQVFRRVAPVEIPGCKSILQLWSWPHWPHGHSWLGSLVREGPRSSGAQQELLSLSRGSAYSPLSLLFFSVLQARLPSRFWDPFDNDPPASLRLPS